MTEKKEPVDELQGENLITLSTGVKLRGKAMPPGVFINLNVKDPPPEPPVIKLPEGYFSNPDDPAFIEKMRFWEQKKNKEVLNAMIVLGTEIIEVPKGIPGKEKNDWIDELELTGIEVQRNNESWRRLWWVLTIAAPLASDWELITKAVGRLTGVPESDVEAASNFPGSS